VTDSRISKFLDWVCATKSIRKVSGKMSKTVVCGSEWVFFSIRVDTAFGNYTVDKTVKKEHFDDIFPPSMSFKEIYDRSFNELEEFFNGGKNVNVN
jgi:hypothetical protein